MRPALLQRRPLSIRCGEPARARKKSLDTPRGDVYVVRQFRASESESRMGRAF
jgi:hypothetical protein